MNNPNEEMSHYVEIIENAINDENQNTLNESSESEEDTLHEAEESSTEIPVGYSIQSQDDGWVWTNTETSSEVFNDEQSAIDDANKHFNDNKDRLEEDEDNS